MEMERKAAGTTPKGSDGNRTRDAVATSLGDRAEAAAPEWLKPYAKYLGTGIRVTGKVIDVVGPVVIKGYGLGKQGYKLLEPYGPEELLPMLVGVLMCVFGGSFMMTISAMEAYRMAGWHETKEHLVIMRDNVRKARAESRKDDEVDADGDGIADVKQIESKELATRKISLFMRVTNPLELSAALSGLYIGLLAVVATLRMRMARTIALGCSLGNAAAGPALKLIKPVAESAVPPEYHNWIAVVVSYVCKGLGVWIAMIVHRVLAAVHSAVRGSQLFCENFATYTRKRGYSALADGYYDEAAMAVVAFMGLYFQLSSSFSIPWLLALPLAPVIIFEKFLGSMVTYTAM